MHRYFWQLLGTILTVIAIFATYDIFLRSRPTKGLQVVLEPPLSLVEMRPEAAGDIKLLYKNQQVSYVSIFQILLQNSGNQPIIEGDYTQPILFSFPKETEIADVTVTGSTPPNVGMTVTKTSRTQAEVSRTLLNPQDTVNVRFVVIRKPGHSLLDGFSVDGRVAGVKHIQLVRPSTTPESQKQLWLNVVSGLIAGLVVVGMSIIADLLHKRRSDPSKGQE